MQILRKASVAIINSLGKGGFKGVTEKRLVMRAVGIAHAVENGTTTFGEYSAFKGEFRVTSEDGEISNAPKLFLPEPAQGLLKAAVTAAEGAPVQFGFDIFIIPDEGSERGYQYRVQSLLESKPSDPLAALMQGVGEFPAIPKQADLPAIENAAPEVASETQAEPVAETGKGKKK